MQNIYTQPGLRCGVTIISGGLDLPEVSRALIQELQDLTGDSCPEGAICFLKEVHPQEE